MNLLKKFRNKEAEEIFQVAEQLKLLNDVADIKTLVNTLEIQRKQLIKQTKTLGVTIKILEKHLNQVAVGE